MPDLYKLQIFWRVVQSGSFSAAAEHMYLSQPTISQHIHELELAFGVKLFERGRRGVTLTAEGNILKDYTERILKLLAEAEGAITNVANLAGGQINIGATPSAGTYLLPKWIRDFRARYTKISVAMQTGTTAQIAAQLAAGRLDLGFVEGELDSVAASQLEFQSICDVPQLVVVGPKHRLWSKASIKLCELGSEPFIMRQPNSQSRQWLDAVLQAHQVRARVVAEFDNPEAIKRSIMMDVAIGVLPLYAVQAEIDEQALRAIDLDVALTRALRAMWRKAVPIAPLARAFMAFANKCAYDMHQSLMDKPFRTDTNRSQ